VHVHIIPRLRSDFGGEPDNVYPALEGAERELNADLVRHGSVSEDSTAAAGAVEAAVEAARRRRENGWQVPKDEERKPRSDEEMADEARWLAGLMA
jgi:bis(5'-adenosyl)-triphosphatase